MYGILLPLDRTALYVAPLFLTAAAAAAAIPLPAAWARVSGRAVIAVMVLTAGYSVGCLRLTYFNEWKYDADLKKVYSVLSYYNRTYGMTRGFCELALCGDPQLLPRDVRAGESIAEIIPRALGGGFLSAGIPGVCDLLSC